MIYFCDPLTCYKSITVGSAAFSGISMKTLNVIVSLLLALFFGVKHMR